MREVAEGFLASTEFDSMQSDIAIIAGMIARGARPTPPV
jgi:hypothetical protein